MLNQKLLTLLSFIILISGCQTSVNKVDPPRAPYHNLDIEGDVQFHSKVSWDASKEELKTKIWAENSSSDTAKITMGPCAFNLLAFSPKKEELVWHNKMPDKYICFDKMILYTIAPDETKELLNQMYISGNSWFWKIPAGEWDFKIKAQTEDGEGISFPANKVKIRYL